MIYSRNSRVLGDVCSPALGLLVPECNVALACEQCCARDYLTAQRLQRVSIHMSMHASDSLCVYALVHVSACTKGGPCPQDFFGKYIPQIAI